MKKLNGYRPSHRNKWLFIKHGILSLQELSLLEFYADILDFDNSHETYGRFITNFAEMIKIFDCKSDDTVRNWHKKLLQLGFIKWTGKRSEYELACFTRYISPGLPWSGEAGKYAEQEKDQPIDGILQHFGINHQTIGEKVQPVGKTNSDIASKISTKALSSSKDESIVNQVKKVVIRQEVRSVKEYQQMYQDNIDRFPLPEDMRWIDENVTETVEVTEENEQDIIDLYFDGDLTKYQKQLAIASTQSEHRPVLNTTLTHLDGRLGQIRKGLSTTRAAI